MPKAGAQGCYAAQQAALGEAEAHAAEEHAAAAAEHGEEEGDEDDDEDDDNEAEAEGGGCCCLPCSLLFLVLQLDIGGDSCH